MVNNMLEFAYVSDWACLKGYTANLVNGGTPTRAEHAADRFRLDRGPDYRPLELLE